MVEQRQEKAFNFLKDNFLLYFTKIYSIILSTYINISAFFRHVQINNICKDLNKRKNTANTQQAKYIEEVAMLVGRVKRGILKADDVTKVLEKIAKQ